MEAEGVEDVLTRPGDAGAHALTAYDTVCLEFAMRAGLALATGDGALRSAAERAGAALQGG